MDCKKYFKGKKVTIMGLGLSGGALNDIIYLAKQRADLTVTDLKNAKELKPSINKLKKYPKIKFVLGGHEIEDFKNADMILQPGNVPEDSPYLLEAKKNRIPVFVSESLFAKYMPDVTIVGVTGTRGKTMTTMATYEILQKNLKGRKVYLGGNIRNVSTLALLDRVKAKDVVVMELDSWALHGMGDIKVSPQVSVFTSFMPDHMNYYKNDMKKYFDDKANIFKFQKSPARNATHNVAGGGDSLFICPGMIEFMPKKIPGILNVVMPEMLDGWNLKVPGKHNQENIACAVEVAELFGIPMEKIKKTIENFKGVEGRLQYMGEVKGVKVYNDNNSTTPEATIAGLEALAPLGSKAPKSIVLIMGGADKKLDTKKLMKMIPKYCKAVVLLPGSGTDKLKVEGLKLKVSKVKKLEDAVTQAFKFAKRGDIILFSPAFASFGLFKNEYDRNDQFVKLIKGMK